MRYQKCDIFYDLEETRGVWRPEPDFRGHTGTVLATVPGRPGRMGSMCTVGHIWCSKLCGVLQVGPTRAVKSLPRFSVIGT
jgi:hypothetical protein